jgi:hypothetical protein
LPTDACGWIDYARELKDLSLLLEHAVQEGREDGDLRWQDQTLQDFFAAVWLTRYGGERQGDGEAGWDDATWMTTGERLPVQALNHTRLWKPVWRFATGMPVVGTLFDPNDSNVVCTPESYVAVMSKLLASGREGKGSRSTEMIYRCWANLLALAGELPVPTTGWWSEVEVQQATTRVQRKVWQSCEHEWGGVTSAKPIELNAWTAIYNFLSEYPALLKESQNDCKTKSGPYVKEWFHTCWDFFIRHFLSKFRSIRTTPSHVAPDFESWFQEIRSKSKNDFKFVMGTEGVYGQRLGTTHETQIEGEFLLAQYPITNAVYGLFDNQHWQRFPGYLNVTIKINSKDGLPEPHPDCPVQFVNWYDSWCACLFLHSRLPTEHEWEYACRASCNPPPQDFWFGDDSSATADFLWCSTTRKERRCDVVGGTERRERRANDFGLYDMHGNLSEWTASWYFDDPKVGRDGYALKSSRVLRGGSFDDIPSDCRSASRVHWQPAISSGNGSFRAARDYSSR